MPDPAKVTSLYEVCFDEHGEVEVEGIVGNARFSRARLDEHADEIRDQLRELPATFMLNGGGGMSFLNACEDRHGQQWTGLHQTMWMLFALGEGVGSVKMLMPRHMWPALPGGMPYYQVVLDA